MVNPPFYSKHRGVNTVSVRIISGLNHTARKSFASEWFLVPVPQTDTGRQGENPKVRE